MRRYYHVYANGDVKEISREEAQAILIHERNWKNTKLLVSVYDNEITLHKGNNYVFIKKESLTKCLGLS